MQHFRSRWTILLAFTVGLLSLKWELGAVIVGAELCSQSLHESIHHPEGRFAHWGFRLAGVVIAGFGAWFLR